MNVLSVTNIRQMLAGAKKMPLLSWALPLGFMVLLCISWAISGYISNRARNDLTRELMLKARILAENINPEMAKQLKFSAADTYNPVFHRLRSQMMTYANATGLASIYTMAHRDGRLYFGPESLAEDDTLASAPGTLYQNPPQELISIFSKQIDRVVVGPYADEYGTFISSFAPIVDPVTNEIIMVVGIDIDARAWLKDKLKERVKTFAALSLIFSIICGLVFMGMWQGLVTTKIIGRYQYRGVVSVFLLGIIGTLLLAVYNYNKQKDQDIELYQSMATDAMKVVLHQVEIIGRHDLPALTDFITASEHVTYDEFSLFSRHILNYHIMRKMSWLPVDNRGYMGTALEKYKENGKNCNNLIANDGTQDYILQALNSGMPVIGSLTRTVKEDDTAVVNIINPVYREDNRSIKGFVALGIILSGLIPKTNGKLEVTLTENPRTDGNSTSMQDIEQSHRALISIKNKYPLFMFDKSYSVNIEPGINFPKTGLLRNLMTVIMSGLMISALVAMLTWVLSNKHIQIERELSARTAELEQSRGQYKSLFDNMLNGASYCRILIDGEGRASDFIILSANKAFEDITGLAQEKIVGLKASEEVPWLFDEPVDWIGVFGRAALKKEGTTLECYSERLDKWLQVTVYGAQPNHFVCLYEDISERKRVDKIYRESQERMEGIFDSVQAGIMVVDKETRVILYVNKAAASMIGLPPQEIISHKCHNFACQADVGACPIIDQGQEVDNSERCLLTIDGRCLPIIKTVVKTELMGRPVLIESFIDISDRVRVENALQEQKAFIEELMDNIPNPVFYKNAKGTYLGCNKAFVRLLGLDKDKIIGRKVFDLTSPDKAGKYHQMDQALLESGGDQVYEYVVESKNDGPRHMLFNKAVFHDAEGRIAGIVGSMVDLTEQYQIQAELKKLTVAIEQSPSIIVITDKQGQIEYVNPMFTKTTGYDKAEVLGQNPRLLKSGDTSQKVYKNLWETIQAGGQWKGEFHNRRKDGSLYWEEATIGPIMYSDGTFDHYLAVKTDITERKQFETIQRSIYKISEITSSSESLPELYAGIHMVIDEIMNTSNLYIALVNQETNYLEFPYFVDEKDARPAPRPLGKGLTEYVIKTGAPLIAPPLVQKNLFSAGMVELVGAPSIDWLGVPLKSGHAVLGALVVQSYNPKVRFGMPELTMLNYISENIAIAIQRKSADDERKRLLADLQSSLASIKTLKGLVPICSSCKKIRNDSGYWQQVEEYVAEHTEADFSHGLCDECAHKLYPQYFGYKKNKTKGDDIG